MTKVNGFNIDPSWRGVYKVGGISLFVGGDGQGTHPQNKGQGPSANEIYFTGEGYMTNTADQSFHVKVKVTKGGDA